MRNLCYIKGMRKILFILMLSLSLMAWFHYGHSLDPGMTPNPNPDSASSNQDLDPGMGTLPQNPDQAGSGKNLDPGMGTLPQNPDQAGSGKNLDPGMGTLPQNPDQAGSPNQDQSQNKPDVSSIWICGKGGASNDCKGLCGSSGYAYSGNSSTDADLLKKQCSSEKWTVACDCKLRDSK